MPFTKGLNPQTFWQHPSRTLTGFTGKPREDVIGEDAAYKDVRVTPTVLTNLCEGALTANGMEQIICEQCGGTPSQVSGHIDLGNLALGDCVTVRVHIKLSAGGEWRKYYEGSFVDAQTTQILHLTTKPENHGLKITMQQTLGTYRNFDYEFFEEA